MGFWRGQYVWWSSNSGPGVGRVMAVDVFTRKIKVQPDNRGFPIWLPVGIRGLYAFPELEIRSCLN